MDDLRLVLTDKPGLVKNVSIIPGISDHDGAIIVDTTLKAILNRKPSKANCEKIKENAALFSRTYVREVPEQSTQDNWNQLKNHFKSTIDSIPSKLSSTRNNFTYQG